MYAPISGRIGKVIVTLGNLVGAAGKDTVLATLVQLDPIYVYFSPSDHDTTDILKSRNGGPITATLDFSDGSKFDGIGKLDFVNNQVDQKTSTVAMRVIMPNPQKILLPGNYVNVQLNLGDRPDTLLIPEKAITRIQGGSVVYVVDDKGIVDERKVATANSYNNMRVITDGLKEGELVVTEGSQRVRDGTKVVTKFEN
jgi:membrane fusion protein (multidrug efflux system)